MSSKVFIAMLVTAGMAMFLANASYAAPAHKKHHAHHHAHHHVKHHRKA